MIVNSGYSHLFTSPEAIHQVAKDATPLFLCQQLGSNINRRKLTVLYSVASHPGPLSRRKGLVHTVYVCVNTYLRKFPNKIFCKLYQPRVRHIEHKTEQVLRTKQSCIRLGFAENVCGVQIIPQNAEKKLYHTQLCLLQPPSRVVFQFS